MQRMRNGLCVIGPKRWNDRYWPKVGFVRIAGVRGHADYVHQLDLAIAETSALIARAAAAPPDGRGRSARQILSAGCLDGVQPAGCGPGARPAAPFPRPLGLALTVGEAQARLPVEQGSTEDSLGIPCCEPSAQQIEH